LLKATSEVNIVIFINLNIFTVPTYMYVVHVAGIQLCNSKKFQKNVCWKLMLKRVKVDNKLYTNF